MHRGVICLRRGLSQLSAFAYNPGNSRESVCDASAAAMLKLTSTVAACVLAVGVCALLAQTSRSTADGVLFEGARLITGDGSVPIERASFLVKDGRFANVGAPRPTRGITRVDLTGKTVMPALVDVHTHLGYRKGATFLAENFTRETILEELNRLAYFGVAAVGSAGTDRGDLTLRLRTEPHPGTLVRTAWRGLAPPNAGPNPPMRDAPYGVSTEAEARQDVRELAARKVDFVKIWVDDRNGTLPKLSPMLYRAIIDEAHKNRLRVFAHIAALDDAKELLRAGVDGFLHPVRDREIDDELLRLLKQRPHVFFALTLFAPRSAAYGERPAWLDEPELKQIESSDLLDRVADALAHRTPDAIATARKEWERIAHNVSTLNRAGVQLVLGTDVGGASAGGLFGWTEHVELEHMVAAGLTPGDAIVAATSAAAAVLHLDELGTIAVGKSADFLVLNGNPLDDIANTRRIARVYLRGAELPRAAK
jgi:imidazolonepropionase-like amidohydrolase